MIRKCLKYKYLKIYIQTITIDELKSLLATSIQEQTKEIKELKEIILNR